MPKKKHETEKERRLRRNKEGFQRAANSLLILDDDDIAPVAPESESSTDKTTIEEGEK